MDIGEYEQIELVCEECGKKFQRYIHDRPQRFCSRECSNRYLRKQSLRKSELEDKVKCPKCGKGMILIWESKDKTGLAFKCRKRHSGKHPVYIFGAKELYQ